MVIYTAQVRGKVLERRVIKGEILNGQPYVRTRRHLLEIGQCVGNPPGIVMLAQGILAHG